MKVAVFSDTQANYPPLITVTEHILKWSPDLVIMNGDLVNRGPRSLDCLNAFESLREHQDWVAIRGNHEDFVLRCSQPNTQPDSPLEREKQRFTHWTSQQMGTQAKVMEDWLDEFYFNPPGHPNARVAAMHGSLVGNRVGIMAHTTDEELADRIPQDLSIFLTAHTHRPLKRTYGNCEILNVGSAGSPFDGDPRASYAQLVFSHGEWKTKIVRLEYDRKAAEQDYYDSGFLDEGGPMAKLIFEEWKRAESLMGGWRRNYSASVEQGEISLKDSIEKFIAGLDK